MTDQPARSLRGDARVLFALLRGQPRHGSHAERLEAFYGPQAGQYDAFRERLLHGRRQLLADLAVPEGGHVVELGAGTGRNLEFFGERRGRLGHIDLVDLCPSLLAAARARTADWPNCKVHEADACTFRPAQPVDAVYLAYALTMIPDWRAAIDNAIAMLKPGGLLGVVDFYVAAAHPAPGLARHGWLTRQFWPRWFAHDGVRPCAEHLDHLRACLPQHQLDERLAPVPYLPGLRVPYYRFVGRVT